MLNRKHMDIHKDFTTSEFTVEGLFLKVTSTTIATNESVVETFTIKDRNILPDVVWLLPVALRNYDFQINGKSLRETIQELVHRVTMDYAVVTC